MPPDLARQQVEESADALDGDDTDEDDGMPEAPEADARVTAPSPVATEPAALPAEVPTQQASVFEPVPAPVAEPEPEPPSASTPQNAPASTDENDRPPRPNAFGSSEG